MAVPLVSGAEVTGAPTTAALASRTVNVTVPASTVRLLETEAVRTTVCGTSLDDTVGLEVAVVVERGLTVSVPVPTLGACVTLPANVAVMMRGPTDAGVSVA